MCLEEATNKQSCDNDDERCALRSLWKRNRTTSLHRRHPSKLIVAFLILSFILPLLLQTTTPHNKKRQEGIPIIKGFGGVVVVVDALTPTINTTNNHDPFDKTNNKNKEEERGIRGHVKTVLSRVHQKYYVTFPKEVKFGIGAVLGYGAAHAVISSATSILKVTGTILVIGELVHFSGICRVDSSGSNQESQQQQHQHCTTIHEMHASLKKIVLDTFDKVYSVVNPNQWRQFMEEYIEQTNETYGPIGLAIGILLGLA